MRFNQLLLGLTISLPGILYAQMTEEQAYHKLADGLHREVLLLERIIDAESAQSTLPALKQVLSELKALNDQVDTDQLWRYLENTPNVKQPLINDTESLFVELQRLAKAQFFSVKPLAELLRPMLTPAAS